MKRILRSLRIHIWTLMLACALSPDAPATPSAAPNILLILADDVGFGDIPANYPAALVPMPNVDRLARSGTRFLDAHTPSSVCAPTRYSVLSGNYPWRGRRPFGTWNFNGGSQFKEGQLALPGLLQSAGYNTAMFGKVHLGARVRPLDPHAGFDESWNPDYTKMDFSSAMVGGPQDLGFSYSFTSPSGIQNGPYAYFENDRLVGDPAELQEWKPGRYPNSNGISIIDKNHIGIGMPYWKSNAYAIDMLDKALAFLDRHIAANAAAGTPRPFFIHYCTAAVHVPHSPPKEFLGQHVLGQTPSRHLDMLLELDLTIGGLLEKLEQIGQIDNTLVIFTSDNGGLGISDPLGHDASGGYRGNKGSVHEGGHRVPLVISWPQGGIPSGAVYPHLTGIQDLFRTIAEIAGTAVPIGQAVDSISFKDALMETNSGPHRRHQLLQTVEQSGYLAWRDGPWKLITDRTGQARELYNLEKDAFEQHNLLDDPQSAERVTRMQRDLIALDPTGLILPGQ